QATIAGKLPCVKRHAIQCSRLGFKHSLRTRFSEPKEHPMKVAVFSTKAYDREYLEAANRGRHQLVFIEAPLNAQTALLAQGAEAVCCFVNDHLDEASLTQLQQQGVRLVALRCAGFNQVDLAS